jgi:hypothetical protein
MKKQKQKCSVSVKLTACEFTISFLIQNAQLSVYELYFSHVIKIEGLFSFVAIQWQATVFFF